MPSLRQSLSSRSRLQLRHSSRQNVLQCQTLVFNLLNHSSSVLTEAHTFNGVNMAQSESLKIRQEFLIDLLHLLCIHGWCGQDMTASSDEEIDFLVDDDAASRPAVGMKDERRVIRCLAERPGGP